MNKLSVCILGFMALLLSSCYHQEPETSDAWIVTEEQMDSISFYTTHHYTQNYNFMVTADSLRLIVQQPSEHQQHQRFVQRGADRKCHPKHHLGGDGKA